jgi:hypothetical protein
MVVRAREPFVGPRVAPQAGPREVCTGVGATEDAGLHMREAPDAPTNLRPRRRAPASRDRRSRLNGERKAVTAPSLGRLQDAPHIRPP